MANTSGGKDAIAWGALVGSVCVLKKRWTIRDLVDFEALLGRGDAVEVDDGVIRDSVKGLEGASARRAGMLAWLEERCRGGGYEGMGEVWASGRFVVGVLVVVFMFLAGVGVMTGLLDRERMGFNIPMVLGVAVGLQILVLVGAALVWLVRGRFTKGLGIVPKLLGWLVGKIGGAGKMEWWRVLRLEGGKGWEALGWNLVRLTQVGAVTFSVGLMAGLLGCIWFLEVGFFWESTTPEWMAARLHEVTGFLSFPWAGVWPEAVPSMGAVIAAQDGDKGAENGGVWYLFLFAAIFFWGLLPRLLLWGFAVMKERAAMGALDFQAKRHRELWREMMGTRRVDVSEAPVDGVLVLDVGGTGLKEESLRGFLLRRLRVNPGEWYEVGVWDEKGEEAARKSIRNAPAGVVFLAEGWALSPPRMAALHRQVRSLAGVDVMIYFLVANAGVNGGPVAPKAEEEGIWRDFVDGLADAGSEIYFYEDEYK
ncbi:DUF2868 domain-containing protein [Luteolibacter sp. AS25]|uniref:DUF2868 domain-containing protein n=1 Tax=Luteolibacter sp. AS25 TaxID=3135776 RepID=UPI00398B3F72